MDLVLPSDAPRPGLSAGAVAGIVIGSLAGAALVGVGVYFLCSGRQSKTPRRGEMTPPRVREPAPRSPGGPSGPAQEPPRHQPTYETLQPGQRDVYDQLQR
nr:carcinoembryonic antigen-related cell adhesion molecule 4-like [Chrysemys picta bellii]